MPIWSPSLGEHLNRAERRAIQFPFVPRRQVHLEEVAERSRQCLWWEWSLAGFPNIEEEHDYSVSSVVHIKDDGEWDFAYEVRALMWDHTH